MSEHHLPKSYDDAIAQGWKPVGDLNAFVTGTLGITMEAFNAQGHRFALDANAVDCSTAPPGTPCRRQCVTDSNGNRVGVIGKCLNGGCALVSGPC